MYERFYQLTANPFRLAPDPNFCFSHSGYKRASQYLEYALDQGEGFVMVTGRPGTGKTLLLEKFIKEIDTSNVVARRIAVSNYSGDDLLRAVAYAYDIEAAELDKATLRHRIHHYFVQHEQAGRRVLLIIDEAQALQHSALEELRILADLQTQSRLMLQLFLVGQESLQDLLRAPDMEQFQQRVIANYHLVPLNLLDTRAYIEYRLLHAGWNGAPEFTSAAVVAIYQLSKGVPRHINKICNRLLLLGFGKGSYLFDEEDVQAISNEMGAEQLTPLSAQAGDDEVDGIANIPEIRDEQVAMTDLAITIDRVDAAALAISEASRLNAANKKGFDTRHNNDPEIWNLPQQPTPAETERRYESTVMPVFSQQPQADDLPAGGEVPLVERYFDRFKWRETVVVTAAMLAITTISIAALPSIFGGAGDSQDTHAKIIIQRPAVQVASHSVALYDGTPVQRTTEPAVAVKTALVESRPVVIPAAPEQREYVAEEVPEVLEMVPVPDRDPGVSWSDHEPVAQPKEHKQQLAVVETAVPEVRKVTASLPVAELHEELAPPESAEPGFINTVYLTTTAEQAGFSDAAHVDAVQELLSRGHQSLSSYRLRTPENDNAYAYFTEVLQLDPANETARTGIEAIVDAYVMLIKKAMRKGSNNRAYRYLDRALGIQPENRELLAMKASLDRRVAIATVASAAPAAEPVPVSESAAEPERPAKGGLLHGIKAFFKKQQAVSVPDGWDGGWDG